MNPCRTLFVGNLLKNKYESPKALEETLWKQFGEWGELESLNVIWRLSIAFPRYRLRTSAGRLMKGSSDVTETSARSILSVIILH